MSQYGPRQRVWVRVSDEEIYNTDADTLRRILAARMAHAKQRIDGPKTDRGDLYKW